MMVNEIMCMGKLNNSKFKRLRNSRIAKIKVAEKIMLIIYTLNKI